MQQGELLLASTVAMNNQDLGKQTIVLDKTSAWRKVILR